MTAAPHDLVATSQPGAPLLIQTFPATVELLDRVGEGDGGALCFVILRVLHSVPCFVNVIVPVARDGPKILRVPLETVSLRSGACYRICICVKHGYAMIVDNVWQCVHTKVALPPASPAPTAIEFTVDTKTVSESRPSLIPQHLCILSRQIYREPREFACYCTAPMMHPVTGIHALTSIVEYPPPALVSPNDVQPPPPGESKPEIRDDAGSAVDPVVATEADECQPT